mmetsp:Transcript_72484/g.205445  ORF Transcript_72484/g.205445 Transcript_72484/m.205445 type:complete len:386 (+) Transcript_72484:242-1399(+)
MASSSSAWLSSRPLAGRPVAIASARLRFLSPRAGCTPTRSVSASDLDSSRGARRTRATPWGWTILLASAPVAGWLEEDGEPPSLGGGGLKSRSCTSTTRPSCAIHERTTSGWARPRNQTSWSPKWMSLLCGLLAVRTRGHSSASAWVVALRCGYTSRYTSSQASASSGSFGSPLTASRVRLKGRSRSSIGRLSTGASVEMRSSHLWRPATPTRSVPAATTQAGRPRKAPLPPAAEWSSEEPASSSGARQILAPPLSAGRAPSGPAGSRTATGRVARCRLCTRSRVTEKLPSSFSTLARARSRPPACGACGVTLSLRPFAAALSAGFLPALPSSSSPPPSRTVISDPNVGGSPLPTAAPSSQGITRQASASDGWKAAFRDSLKFTV